MMTNDWLPSHMMTTGYDHKWWFMNDDHKCSWVIKMRMALI